MRWFSIFMLLSACFSQEILRPATDANGGALSFNNNGCVGSLIASGSMPLSHDLAGLSTNSSSAVIGNSLSDQYSTRVFLSWGSTVQSYTGLTLNINSSSDGYLHFNPLGTGNAGLFYSTDSGATWHVVLIDSSGTGWSQRTSMIPLSTSQNLANLRVGVCVQGDKGSKGGDSGPPPGKDDITVWDIWTSGLTGPATTGNGSGKGLAVRSIVGIN